jgi:hypothetical protein
MITEQAKPSKTISIFSVREIFEEKSVVPIAEPRTKLVAAPKCIVARPRSSATAE